VRIHTYRAPQEIPPHKVLVPTLDTVRGIHLLSTLLAAGVNTLLVGPSASGKTLLANGTLQQLPSSYSSLTLSLGTHSTAGFLQDHVEGHMEKRTKVRYTPLK
jgi:dynein heavy chain, axonemal